jgi:hypothetical protein
MSPPSSGPEVIADQLRTPEGYEGWTADQKGTWLWETAVLGTEHVPSALPPLRLPFQDRPVAEIGVVTRTAELDKALSRTSDLMEPGRPKVIHALGAVARVELETDRDSPFTGLLAPPPDGGAHGLIRLSLVARVVGRAAFTPGFGLKLFIDGKPSADLLGMNHVVGQGRDFDLFSNTMTTDLSEEHGELRPPQRVMGMLFRRVSHQPRRLVVTHLARQFRDGAAVADPVGPRRLVFQPTAHAKRVFAGQAGVDFRRVLAEVPTGTALYDVEGLGSLDEGPIPDGPVGVIRTVSPFVSSDGGDRLFFRHVQDPGDRKLGPAVSS